MKKRKEIKVNITKALGNWCKPNKRRLIEAKNLNSPCKTCIKKSSKILIEQKIL